MNADAFLETIRENPDDDGPRLVYADWLEERGDPRSEFIRVQCELSRVEQDGDVPDLQGLQQREEDLLNAHRKEWLGPLAKFEKEHSLTAVFHRGFVERINVDTDLLVGEFETIDQALPALRSAVLYNVVDNIEGLALCPLLGRLSDLGIADWIYYSETQMLANSRHLQELKSIWLWVREYGQAQEVGLALIDAPGLEEVTLLHLYDSTQAAEPPAEETRWRLRVADELNERVLADRGAIFHVASSSNLLFNVRSSSEVGYLAGKLADRQGIAVVDRDDYLHVVGFDREGKYLGRETRSLRRDLLPPESQGEHNERWSRVQAYLKRAFGFEPGEARVREFVDSRGLAVHQFPSMTWRYLFVESERDADSKFLPTLPRRVHEWIESRRCVLDWDGEHYLEADGSVTKLNRSEPGILDRGNITNGSA